MKLISYPDSASMFTQLAMQIGREITSALEANPHVSLAVPGGNTPGPLFDRLARSDLDWSRVHLMLTDERKVPADHPRSNERLVRARLMTDHAQKAHFVRLLPDGSSDAPNNSIAPYLPLSVLVLGMGADMHTASLFPDAKGLDLALSDMAPPVMAISAPEGLEPRVTLTAPVLRAAKHIHVLIIGADKRTAVEAARELAPHKAPIAAVLPKATVHWAP